MNNNSNNQNIYRTLLSNNSTIIFRHKNDRAWISGTVIDDIVYYEGAVAVRKGEVYHVTLVKVGENEQSIDFGINKDGTNSEYRDWRVKTT